MVAEAAQANGCRSVAYTYNDPVIFLEYAIDVAKACAQRGIKSVAVTAGYIDPEPRETFFRAMDAAAAMQWVRELNKRPESARGTRW